MGLYDVKTVAMYQNNMEVNVKYFHVYRDGVQIWPIGIICIKRIRGFGFGFSKKRGSDVLIGVGILFTVHIIQINWKMY